MSPHNLPHMPQLCLAKSVLVTLVCAHSAHTPAATPSRPYPTTLSATSFSLLIPSQSSIHLSPHNHLYMFFKPRHPIPSIQSSSALARSTPFVDLYSSRPLHLFDPRLCRPRYSMIAIARSDCRRILTETSRAGSRDFDNGNLPGLAFEVWDRLAEFPRPIPPSIAPTRLVDLHILLAEVIDA